MPKETSLLRHQALSLCFYLVNKSAKGQLASVQQGGCPSAGFSHFLPGIASHRCLTPAGPFQGERVGHSTQGFPRRVWARPGECRGTIRPTEAAVLTTENEHRSPARCLCVSGLHLDKQLLSGMRDLYSKVLWNL